MPYLRKYIILYYLRGWGFGLRFVSAIYHASQELQSRSEYNFFAWLQDGYLNSKCFADNLFKQTCLPTK